VARKAVEGLVAVRMGRSLTDASLEALELLMSEQRADRRLFIIPATANVLKLYSTRAEVLSFRERVEVLYPTRYFSRWARRMQSIGFSRDDARVISLATFGTDEKGAILGVDAVLTFDKPMFAVFEANRKMLAERLAQMIGQAKPPYDKAKLPRVVSPTEV
jgi:hypothetical protein